MQARDIRLNVITLDFGNELGQDDSEEDEEINEEADKMLLGNGSSKKKKEEVGPVETTVQNENKGLLIDMINKIKGAIFPAKVAMEVCQQFKKREVMSRARYRGNFDLAADLKLGVQIYPRTREETFPTLKRFSKVAEKNPDAA